MTAALAGIDDLLRGRPAGRHPALLIGTFVAGGLAYGAVMGSYGGWAGDRAWQIVFAAVKVPLLVGVTFLLTLPSFFVLNALAGLRADFGEALRAMAVTQAAVAVVLASLAPYTALWYVTSGGYHEAILFNAAMFGAASVAAQRLLWRKYQPLIARDPRHRVMLRVWLGLYAFVGVQMGWVLRPFVGELGQPVQFFRPGAWGNAYVVVFEMIVDVVMR